MYATAKFVIHTNNIISYQNQKEVGEGIRRAFQEFGIKREDVFIVRLPTTFQSVRLYANHVDR